MSAISEFFAQDKGWVILVFAIQCILTLLFWISQFRTYFRARASLRSKSARLEQIEMREEDPRAIATDEVVDFHWLAWVLRRFQMEGASNGLSKQHVREELDRDIQEPSALTLWAFEDYLPKLILVVNVFHILFGLCMYEFFKPEFEFGYHFACGLAGTFFLLVINWTNSLLRRKLHHLEQPLIGRSMGWFDRQWEGLWVHSPRRETSDDLSRELQELARRQTEVLQGFDERLNRMLSAFDKIVTTNQETMGALRGRVDQMAAQNESIASSNRDIKDAIAQHTEQAAQTTAVIRELQATNESLTEMTVESLKKNSLLLESTQQTRQEFCETMSGVNQTIQEFQVCVQFHQESLQELQAAHRTTRETSEQIQLACGEFTNQVTESAASVKTASETLTAGVAGLSAAHTEVHAVCGELNSVAHKLTESQQQLSASIAQLGRGGEQFETVTRQMEETARTQLESADAFRASCDSFSSSANTIANTSAQTTRAVQSLNEQVDSFGAAVTHLREVCDQSDQTIKRLDDTANGMNESTRALRDSVKTLQQSTVQVQNASSEVANIIHELTANISRNLEELDQKGFSPTRKSLDELQRLFERLRRDLDTSKVIQEFRTAVQDFSLAISAMDQVTQDTRNRPTLIERLLGRTTSNSNNGNNGVHNG